MPRSPLTPRTRQRRIISGRQRFEELKRQRIQRMREDLADDALADAETVQSLLVPPFDEGESSSQGGSLPPSDVEDDDESGDEVAVDVRKKSKKKKAKKEGWNAMQKCKSLQEILDEAEYHKYPSWVPNFASIAAAPSRYPQRQFCSVSGLMGKYKCPVTGDYLATLEAYETHRETRLKGLI